MKLNFWILVIGAIVVSGCAGLSTSSISYIQPNTDKKPINSVIIKDDFSNTWDRLIGRLAEQYFVINNVEKASRILNVSFSGRTPTDFIDCGQTTRLYTPGPGMAQEAQTFEYDVAAPVTSFLTTIQNPMNPNYQIPVQVRRTTSLEGRTNIYLAPSAEGETKVSVNTRYIFTVRVNGTNQLGQMVNFPPVEPVSFNTTEVFERLEEGMTFQCVSKGTIEREILRAAQIN